MRILAIRGKNLASLAGEFEVDFQKAPLDGPGVFAISGATGAGKSTLLDALCLALYHETPRLLGARENGIKVPDVGTETLAPQDPRNLLRRGCADGYAEVDFVGRDNHPRRARWEVRRSRGSPTGKLQNASVSLKQIDTDTTVASALRETREAIEKCIGLSFDQFRRAVLLAQNDFATLLKAGQTERADLLEALTNTGIFSQVSKAAYARHASEQQAVDQLQQKLNILTPLPADERATLDVEVTEGNTRCTQLALALKELQVEDQWHGRGVELNSLRQAAEQERDRQQQAFGTELPQRQQLQSWNVIAPLRLVWENHGKLIDDTITLQSTLPALEEAIEQTKQSENYLNDKVLSAEQSLEQARQQRENAQPILFAARQADESMRHKQGLLIGLQQSLNKSKGELNALLEKIRHARTEQVTLQTVTSAWTQWRGAHTELGVEDAWWPALGENLRNAEGQKKQTLQAHADIAELGEQQQTCQGQLDTAAQAFDEAKTMLTAVQAMLKTCNEAYEILDLTSIAAHQKVQNAQIETVNKFAVALTALTAAQKWHDEATAKHLELQSKLVTDETAVTAAFAAVEEADIAARDARIGFDLANLAANEITQRLREELKDGEPCMVCGALEHPVENVSHPDSTNELVNTLKKNCNDADKYRDGARALHERAKADFSATQGAVSAVSQDIKKAEAQRQKERAHCVETGHPIDGIGTAASEQGIDALALLLINAKQKLARQAEELEQSGIRITEATQALDHHRIAVEKQREVSEQLRQNHEAIKDRLIPIAAKVFAQKTLATTTEQALQTSLGQLRKYCGNTKLDATHIAPLLVDWSTGETIRSEADRARAPLASSTSAIEGQEQQSTDLARQIADGEEAISTQKNELSQASEQRLRTLTEPDVEAYAKKLQDAETTENVAFEGYRKSHQNAAKLHGEAVASRKSAASKNEDLIARFEQADQQLQQLEQQLAQQSQTSDGQPLSAIALSELFESLPDDLDQRNVAHIEREQSLRDTKTTWDTLNHQYEQWQGEAKSSRTRDEVTAEQTNATDRNNNATTVQADLRARLREDQNRHTQATEHLTRIEALTLQVRRWQKLNLLIGSASGDKFKTYAQQFTLDALLDYANQHLARLAPRYKLRRGNEPLSLLVIDADFADEVRSVHSLSGGESFLVSLALALGLASLSSERVQVKSLFIDEGFGSLDADTLNMAMEALDSLQSQGRRVGVISHVHEMAERIGVQIKVRSVAPGRSVVEISG